MIHKYNHYWRSMVKDALGCDDDYADILLNYQHTVSNGIDTSEATTHELNKYWKWIHLEYQAEKEGAK
jgi:hypothetical protein